MKLILVIYCLTGLLAAHEHHGDHDHDEFEWSEEKSAFAQIQVEVAGPGLIQNFTQAAGRIVAHPDHLAYVIPKITGTVIEVRKNLGDLVEKGEVMAIIESHDAAEAKSHYLLARKRLSMQQQLLKNETALRGISAGHDFLAAELSYEEAAIEYECAKQKLYSLGLSEQEVGQERFYQLRAPLDGKVLERNLTLGELADGSAHAFIVGNFEKIWVEMHIAQEDVPFIKEGQTIECTSCRGDRVVATVCQFSPTLSEETRMAKAIASIDNPGGCWSPGQYINASILTKSTEVPLVVPKEAVQKIKGESYLFVQCGENFEPCRVRVGKTDEKNIEILAGIESGTSYVSTNAFTLKADFEKEEVEHSH